MIECHGSPVFSIHSCQDVNGDTWLFVRHEDDCISILRDQPKPECLVTLTGETWLKVIAGVFDRTLDRRL